MTAMSGWLQVSPVRSRGPITRCTFCFAVRLVPAGCPCPANVAAWQEHMRAMDAARQPLPQPSQE